MISAFRRGAAGFALLALATLAPATVLTMERVSGSGSTWLNSTDFGAYGDRVTSTVQGDFRYGSTYGWTPNVVTSFSATPGSSPAGWHIGYGNLNNVVWGSGPSSTLNEVTVSLSADAGFFVFLHEFTLAQWSNGTERARVEVKVDGVSVLNEFRMIPNGAQNSNYRYLFNQPLMGSQIDITFGNAWWHAIDDVGFSQAVPEPGTMAALGLGALALLRRRRKSA